MVDRDRIKPNLKAPRFRVPTKRTNNKEFLEKLKTHIPKANSLTDTELKYLIKSFNTLLYTTVIEHRDGVDLPESMGNIFIGTCQPKVRKNVDFKTSSQYSKILQHRNLESDDYLAKIFYTNHTSKHRFKNHELWGFRACRKFSRLVGKTYPENWKRYIQVDHTLKISKLFRRNATRMIMDKKDKYALEAYDEFNLD